jgi:hypothetical protein
MKSKYFSTVRFSVLAKGLCLLFVFTVIFYYIQYANFLSEVSKLGKGVTFVGDEIYSSTKIILIEYFCVFIAYAIASSYVAKKSKEYALKNCLLMGVSGGLILAIYSILFNQENVKIYYARYFFETCFGILICIVNGILWKKLRKSERKGVVVEIKK